MQKPEERDFRSIVLDGPYADPEPAVEAIVEQLADGTDVPADEPPVDTHEYEAVNALCSLMRALRIPYDEIQEALLDTGGVQDMITRFEAEYQGRNSNRVYREAATVLQDLAGGAAAQRFVRDHRSWFESRSDQEVMANALMTAIGDVTPEALMQQLGRSPVLSRDELIRMRNNPPERRQTDHDVFLSPQQWEEIRHWGRDTLDEQTRREVMQNGLTDEESRRQQLRVPQQSIPTAHTLENDNQQQQIDDAVHAEITLLYDWLWQQICHPRDWSYDGSYEWNTIEHASIQHSVNQALRPFHVNMTLRFDNREVSRRTMNCAANLHIVSANLACDLHGRRIVGKLLAHPAILLAMTEDGLYEPANYGHRNPPEETCESDGGEYARPIDLRGRDGGSSSDTATGGPTRRRRSINLDL